MLLPDDEHDDEHEEQPLLNMPPLLPPQQQAPAAAAAVPSGPTTVPFNAQGMIKYREPGGDEWRWAEKLGGNDSL